MSEQIVALSADKVQTFLMEVVHSHVQEKQTEDATLKNIIYSSEQISEGFFESIQEQFADIEKQVLLKCSGVFIFRCNLPEDELENRLNALFKSYYLESEGQKLLRWNYFPAKKMDNLKAIQTAKRNLKSVENWNRMIEKNREVLFSFAPVQEKKNAKYIEREQKEFRAFSRDINALAFRKREENSKTNRFRIAVIKADLDGMGEMFKHIQTFEEYKTISQILNEQISLKGFHEAALQYESDRNRRWKSWIFPFYIAGDDIFFAVAVENLISGINVCRTLMEKVNQKIKENGIETHLSLSIGVEITFNSEPIRYYMEMVEAQLKNAKSTEIPPKFEQSCMMKISIGNLTFLDIKERTGNDNIPHSWKEFLGDLQTLNDIRKNTEYGELLGRAHFFYTLLEDITHVEVQENDERYINHVLYHILPRYFEASDKKLKDLEYSLNYNLIKQLYGEDGKEIVVCRETKERLEKYLRLMLLFSDVRFRIFREEYQYRKPIKKREKYQSVFEKIRKYLYENCLKMKAPKLTDIFAREVINEKSNKKGYCCLKLETSMFYRLRDLEKIPVRKAANMIELRNPSTEEERQKIEDVNKKREQAKKLPGRLFFEKDRFLEVADQEKQWTQDFIDSLMLFYQYHELTIKSSCKNQKKEKSENGKQDKNKNKNTVKSVYRRKSKSV